MDATSGTTENRRRAARIPHPQTERRVRAIHPRSQVLILRTPAHRRTANPRPTLRLGFSTRGCRQEDAVLEMRQEAMHAQSCSTPQTPRVYVLTKLKTGKVISGPSAAPLVSILQALAGGVSLAFSRRPASRGEHQSFRRWIRASSACMTACQPMAAYASVITPAITQILYRSSGGGVQPSRECHLPSHDACRASIAQHRRFHAPPANDGAVLELSPVPRTAHIRISGPNMEHAAGVGAKD
jgi:hypothetical protein